ncbi:MAG TPA: methionyl-tRNA formyltransferase [Burkholderiales bacterium]|nr:methionyl-tRNA formyltransferase [Burkholderiales bacterium]
MRLAFAGTPEFAERSLAALLGADHQVALVLTQPDRPAGRGMRPLQSAVKRLALQHELDVFQPTSLNSPASLDRIVGARAELLVVAAYGLILPQSVLDCAPLGALNVHASLLPRWRGAAPIQRAILAGDRESGITIMKMDAGLDTGPILAQRAVPIMENDDAGTLHDRLAVQGAEMIVAALSALETGRASYTPQPAAGVTYARKIDKSELTLDWSRPAQELARAVRAFRPIPGASSTLEGANVKIWEASVVEGSGEPGRALAVDQNGIVIACGQGALVVTRLQRAGGKRLTAGEFLRGHAIAPGTRFGQPAERG